MQIWHTRCLQKVPISPLWRLHGVKWQDEYCFYTSLVFGSRSSPKLFDCLSQAVCWIATENYKVSCVLHLLDNFLQLCCSSDTSGSRFCIISHIHVYYSEQSLRLGDLGQAHTHGIIWNGISMFRDTNLTLDYDFHLYTDAASTFGFGGILGHKWFSGHWLTELSSLTTTSLSLLEQYPIVVAVFMWGQYWGRKQICFHCDNLGLYI